MKLLFLFKLPYQKLLTYTQSLCLRTSRFFNNKVISFAEVIMPSRSQSNTLDVNRIRALKF